MTAFFPTNQDLDPVRTSVSLDPPLVSISLAATLSHRSAFGQLAVVP